MIGDFHFLRPWWLCALVPCALIIWAIVRSGDGSHVWKGIIAPHLLSSLLISPGRGSRFQPWHLMAILCPLMVIAVAGPAWRPEPSPFADDTAALAIVIKVSPSMVTEDLPPNRLERSVLKIHDLLELRKGAKSALIAYAGTAHTVMPATTDEGIINNFAGALDPKIMPQDGDAAAAAFRLADRILADAGSGSILWITDSIAPEQVPEIEAWRTRSRTTVRLLPPLLPGGELDELLSRAGTIQAKPVSLSADDSDVTELARHAKFATVTASSKGERWREDGWWLTPLIAILMLPFFRRGWMPSTASST